MGARLGPLLCGNPRSGGGQLTLDWRRRGGAWHRRDAGLRLVPCCLRPRPGCGNGRKRLRWSLRGRAARSRDAPWQGRWLLSKGWVVMSSPLSPGG